MSRFKLKIIKCSICNETFKTFQIKSGICKKCQKKNNNYKYYLKNKKYLQNKSKQYRQDNKLECKKRDKGYYLNNKEKINKTRMKKYWTITKCIPRKVYLNNIKKPLHLWITNCGNTIKKKARILLSRAVRKERIIKPNKCSCCKRKLPKRVIHAHHENYKKWWDVIWLCQSCHAELHIKKILRKDIK